MQEQETTFDHILVSDAGKPFQILSDAALGFIGQSVRATDILWDRVWQLERENFGHHEGFTFLPITEPVCSSDDPSAMPAVIQAEVQTIRTDLDRFSDVEINVLAQHGYEVTRKLCRQQKLLGEQQLPEGPPWAPIPSKDAKTTTQTMSGRTVGPAIETRLARLLQKSSQRRVLSTLVDWRDWPSYIYMVLAFVLLFFLPLQVYQLYRKSQMQADIIKSIAAGDPDIHQILELGTSDPTANWVGEEILEKPPSPEVNYEGMEVLSHSRIYDLRRWHPDEESQDRRGHVYVRDRITLKLLETYDGDGHFIFRAPIRMENVEFRQPNDGLRGVISRVTDASESPGQKPTVYEFDYDLSDALPEEPVTIEVELIGNVPRTVRAPFVTHTKTDLISVWLLFPADEPYRTYSLVSYPVDKKSAPRPMTNRYAIDHPYGFLIGWSVVNPEEDRVYECRWTTD